MDGTGEDIRREGIDALKGVAIFGVVAIHVFAILAYPVVGGAADLARVGFSLPLFAVPVFVGVTAYFAVREFRSGPRRAVSRRLGRMVVPYAGWTVGYVLLMLALGGAQEGWLRSKGVWEVALLGGATEHMYFLPMLAQVLVVLPLVVWAVGVPRRALLAVAGGSGLLLLSLGVRRLPILAEVFADHWAITFLPAAVVGAAIGTGALRVRRPLLWILGGFAAVLLQTGVAVTLGIPTAATTYALAGLPFVVAGAIVVALRWDRPPRWLVEVGRRSLGIYLVHVALLHGAELVVGRSSTVVVALFLAPVLAVLVAASWGVTRAIASTPFHALVDGKVALSRRAVRTSPTPASTVRSDS